MKLLRSELLRLRSRRLVHWMGIGMAGVLLITWFVVFVNPPTQTEVTFTNQIPNFTEAVATFDTRQAINFIYGFSLAMLGIGVLVGSSAIGAEWATRGLTNVLTWENRRGRLMAAKLGAIAIVLGLGILTFYTLLITGLYLVMSAVGSVENFSAASVLLAILRTTFLALMVAALGATASAVMRSATAAFVVAFVLLAVLQPLLLNWIPGAGPWMFTTNAVTFLLWVDTPSVVRLSQPEPAAAGLVLFGYASVFIAVSLAVFRKQEIG